MSHVQFWAADRGACGHYRCVLPGGALRDQGHTVRVDLLLDRYSLCETDVIVGQRVHEDGPSTTWRDLAKQTDRGLLVYELDDDVWSLPREVHNPASRVWTQAKLRNVEANLACADAVTVSTAVLAEVVSEHTSAPVHVVPNAVPDALLETALPLRVAPHVLGWSGSDTHNGDWLEDRANRAVVRWLGRTRGWELITIGRPPEPLTQATKDNAIWWTPQEGTRDVDEYYAKVRTQFDIGLAPLARTTFNRSKSDLRLLELAAVGIPWLATDFGPYATGAGAHGGLRARSFPEWADKLTVLSENDTIRQAASEMGRKWARTRTVSAILPQWQKALGLDSR